MNPAGKLKVRTLVLSLILLLSFCLMCQAQAFAGTNNEKNWPFVVEKNQQYDTTITIDSNKGIENPSVRNRNYDNFHFKAEKNESENDYHKYYSVKFREQYFPFRDNPVLNVNGEIYICAVDPDFNRMFDAMGITHSWFNTSQRLFLHYSGRTITWFVNQKTAQVGDREISIPLTVKMERGKPYLPLRTIAGLLDFKLTPDSKFVKIQSVVSISTVNTHDENTIDFLVSSPSRIEYNVTYTSKPPTVRLTIPYAGYAEKLKNFSMEGVRFTVTDMDNPDSLSVLLEFPEHWRGVVVPSGSRNQALIRMRPNMVYAWGTKEEVLTSVEPSSDNNLLSLLFQLSNPVQYYWFFNADENKLYIDFPFVLKGHRLDSLSFRSSYIKNYRVRTFKTDNVTITRFEIELADGIVYKVGEPRLRDFRSFALVIGPEYLISDPSPYQGSAGIPVFIGNKVIVIDPGHGGSDPGAVYNGIREKDLTLCIAKSLASQLTQRGWKVILTRDTDRDVSFPGSRAAAELQARVDVAHRHNAALFISIHCNASLNRSARGTSIHWFKPEDRQFALALRDALGANIGTTNRGISKDQFYVLSRTRVPAVLVEAAFMSNTSDLRILSCFNNRQKIAEHLARSIDHYMNSPSMASIPVRTSGSGE
jgi:N-acetylmuramoyl-L-alanine amidase